MIPGDGKSLEDMKDRCETLRSAREERRKKVSDLNILFFMYQIHCCCVICILSYLHFSHVHNFTSILLLKNSPGKSFVLLYLIELLMVPFCSVADC